MILRRDGSDEESARALWDTHKFINDAVAHYAKLLLEMRQREVCVGRDENGKDVVRDSDYYSRGLLKRLEARGVDEGTANAALPRLRVLYEDIIKSAGRDDKGKPLSGTADDARAYHSPLTDPQSKGFLEGDGRTRLLAELVRHTLAEGAGSKTVKFDKASAVDRKNFEAAARTLFREHSKEILEVTGAPKGWKKAWDSDPRGDAWVEKLWEDVRKLGARNLELVETRAWLRKNGALTLLEPWGKKLIEGDSLSIFERVALKLCSSHMLSWESWCARAQAEFEERKAKLELWDAQRAGSHADALERVREYEAAREITLRREALWSEESRYRINRRSLRGWDKLREWLRSHADASEAKRRKFLADLQTRMRGSFGDPHLLGWLADPAQQFLASAGEDMVMSIAVRNGYEEVLSRTRRNPVLTVADPLLHPRWLEFGKPGDANSPQYRFIEEGRRVVLPLLAPGKGGNLEEKEFTFELAPSGQLDRPVFDTHRENKKKKTVVSWQAQDGLGTNRGELGGGGLLFDRRTLENLARRGSTGPETASEMGGVWVKLSVEIGAEHQDRIKSADKARFWMQRAHANRQKTIADSPNPGFRILSVDLGLRSAAACSVFSLVEKSGTGSIALGDKVPFDLKHERSFLLRLPGEDPSRRERSTRSGEADRVYAVRGALRHLANLRRVAVADSAAARTEALDRLRPSPWAAGGVPPVVEATSQDLAALRAHLEDDQGAWLKRCIGVYENVEKGIAAALGELRSNRARGRLGGKSAWAIEHLEELRKVLLQWDRHAHPASEAIRRLNRSKQGTVAGRLLRHINNLKEDRIKTTADLIVQAARGIVQCEGGGWEQCHDQVDLVLFEDLSRYRMRTDRPRRDNRQLMRWCHREVVDTVRMQAEAYGLVVADTGAAFSSQFDAVHRAPGSRCHRMTRDDLRDLGRLGDDHWIAREVRNRQIPIEISALREGDLVPLPGGEEFAGLEPGGGLRITNADINAAQGLARRFAEGHTVAFRARPRETRLADEVIWTLAPLGERLAGAFEAKAVVFRETNPASGRYLAEGFSSVSKLASALGVKAASLEDKDSEEDASGSADALEDDLSVLDELMGAERKTLFRDPSEQIGGGNWCDAGPFWGMVRAEVVRRLQAAGHLGRGK